MISYCRRPPVWVALVMQALMVSPCSAGQPAKGALPPVLSTTAEPPTGARPEPAAMSGYPLQVGDLPPGIVAVRVIRETFQVNVPGAAVLLRVGDSATVLRATTDVSGRAQFDGLRVGESVRVRATVGGETLESRRFDIPTQGGVRMVLVAGVGAGIVAEAWPAPGTAASTPESLTGMSRAVPAASVSSPQAAASRRGVKGIEALAGGLVGAGAVLFAGMKVRRFRVHARRQAERARIFDLLVQLERTHRQRRDDEPAYRARREALVVQLIELDDLLDSPPSDRSTL